MSTVTSPRVLDSTGQSIATAISSMSATSVGNLAALTTTDKTSLVAAVNELKSGLIEVKSKFFVPPSETVTSDIYGDVSIDTGLNLTGKAVFSVDKLAYGGDVYATIVAVYANGIVTLKLRKHSDYSIVAKQQINISDIMLLIV